MVFGCCFPKIDDIQAGQVQEIHGHCDNFMGNFAERKGHPKGWPEELQCQLFPDTITDKFGKRLDISLYARIF